MTTGEKIKNLRTKAQISQTELAKAIGVTKQTIYKYENNIITNIPHEKLEAIANYFHVSPASLLFFETCDFTFYADDMRFHIELQDNYQARIASYYRVFKIAQLLSNDPELSNLFESVQKLDKKDIPFLTELVNKMTK